MEKSQRIAWSWVGARSITNMGLYHVSSKKQKLLCQILKTVGRLTLYAAREELAQQRQFKWHCLQILIYGVLLVHAGYTSNQLYHPQGDSGGALVCGDVAQGIVSFNTEESNGEYRTRYTHISKYLPWIHQVMNSSPLQQHETWKGKLDKLIQFKT